MSMDFRSHIIWCPSYIPLREGLSLDSDIDIVKYCQAVMQQKEKDICPQVCIIFAGLSKVEFLHLYYFVKTTEKIYC